MKKQLFNHGEPIRLISNKRAVKLSKQGVHVFYSTHNYSMAWYVTDLYGRKVSRTEVPKQQ